MSSENKAVPLLFASNPASELLGHVVNEIDVLRVSFEKKEVSFYYVYMSVFEIFSSLLPIRCFFVHHLS